VLGKVVGQEADFVEHQLPDPSEEIIEKEWDSVDEEIKEVEDAAVRSAMAVEPPAELQPLSPLQQYPEPIIPSPTNRNEDFDAFFRRFQEIQGIHESENENQDDEF